MKVAILNRYYQDSNCTLGFLKIGGVDDPIFYTIERPWMDNQKDISCIPSGDYDCFIRQSPSNGEVYELKGTGHRTHVQIHKGNFVRNVIGCIAIGESAGYLPDKHDGNKMKKAVKSSSSALNKFKTLMSFEDFTLRIIGGDNKWSS